MYRSRVKPTARRPGSRPAGTPSQGAGTLRSVRIIAVLNQKGGVGKTTTAVNLGAALALRGKRVLLIDSDAQGNLTDHLGIDPDETDATLYEVLVEGARLDDATTETTTERLFVVPAHEDLAAAETELAAKIGRELRLRKAVREIPADRYDWVLIDCPPSLGLLSLNAMAAAHEVLITVQTEYFALRGLGQLDRIVEMVKEEVNPSLELLGILPTLVNPVTNLAKEVIDEIRRHYGDRVFATRIRQNIRLAEAPSHQTHIFAYDANSAGAEDYTKLADEVLRVRDVKSAAPVAPPSPAIEIPQESEPGERESDETEAEAEIETMTEREPVPESTEAPAVGETTEAPSDAAIDETPEPEPVNDGLPESFDELPTAPRIREATERPPLVFPIIPAPNGEDESPGA